MTRKLTALLAAAALAATTLAPAVADARDHGRYEHNRYYDRHDYRGYNDHGDAVAAGVIGLVLGLAIASAASGPHPEQGRCYNNYQRCGPPPPPPCGNCNTGPGAYAPPSGDPRYSDPDYVDPRYDPNSAYERDYGDYKGEDLSGGPDNSRCTRRERQYDRYAHRTVTVDVPC